jgi:hypothetical protein
LTVEASLPAGLGRIVVKNAYQWVGNPGLAGFVVYLDRSRAGVAPLSGELTVQAQPGAHVLRVRLWWFLSAPVRLSLESGQTRRFSADIPRTKLAVARMVRGVVDPCHSLSLQEVPES